ncbi:hypothetical protein LRY60_06220 [Candidatus Woesebacteria bacterium]|nr:hypothetical protein [Candidatus Woesebacteria bacterium]
MQEIWVINWPEPQCSWTKELAKILGEALSFDDADNMPLRKAINLAYEFYVANGLNQATVEDLLAKGLFSMSLYMGELAKSCVFKKVK